MSSTSATSSIRTQRAALLIASLAIASVSLWGAAPSPAEASYPCSKASVCNRLAATSAPTTPTVVRTGAVQAPKPAAQWRQQNAPASTIAPVATSEALQNRCTTKPAVCDRAR